MQQPVYSDDLKVKDALQIYFKKYHFENGGYDDKYFKIKLGPLLIPFPNTKARIRGVKVHDIHHLLTEYTAFWKGETEIGAWEIASGCGNMMVGWFLNFGSFSIGLFLFPRSVFKAFMMGRHIDNNLYHGYEYGPALLNRTIGELRKELGIGKIRKNNTLDVLYFLVWVALALGVITGLFTLFCLLIELF
jgi:hypothetical protein